MKNRSKDLKITLANVDAIQDLYEIFSDKEVNEIITLLFEDTLDELRHFQNYNNTHSIQKRIDLIVDFTHYDKKVNVNKVKKQFKYLHTKIEEKVHTKVKGKKNKNRNKDLRRLSHTVLELSEIVDAFQVQNDKQNEFLKSVVFEAKNPYFLKNTLNYFPESINTTDENNKTIMYDVISKYMDLIDEDISSDEICYYQDVIDIIINNHNFTFNPIERNYCLVLLLDKIRFLNVNDKNYNEKKSLLIELKDTMTNNQKKKVPISQIEKKYHIHVKFDEYLLEMMRAKIIVRPTPTAILKDEYIISIDGENAVELDDAFSARQLENGNYLLGVHIASVTSVFDYNSDIVREAIAKSETLYYNGDINPIFPLEYSANYGSLIQGVPKYTESHYFEISRSGEIVNESLLKTVIVNNNRTTYDKVDDVIKNGTPDVRFNETVKTLVKITDALGSRYGIDTHSEMGSNRKLSNEIVLVCNMLHNEQVANFFAENKFPIIYRVQEKKTDFDADLEYKLRELANICQKNNYEMLSDNILHYNQAATYALSGRHEGLNLDHYTHCSSPLRRGADVVVQRGVDLFYHNIGTDRDKYRFEDELPTTMNSINKQNEKIKRFLYECKTKGRV